MLKIFERRGRQPNPRIGSEAEFHRLLKHETQRTTRSGRSFIVVRVALPHLLQHGDAAAVQALLDGACGALRETDWIGWSQAWTCLGLIYTETGSYDGEAAAVLITQRLHGIIAAALPADAAKQVQLSFECFASEQPTDRLAAPANIEKEELLPC